METYTCWHISYRHSMIFFFLKASLFKWKQKLSRKDNFKNTTTLQNTNETQPLMSYFTPENKNNIQIVLKISSIISTILKVLTSWLLGCNVSTTLF